MTNEVIDQLAEIEKAAVGIIEHTNTQKAEMMKEAERKRIEYDQKLQADIDAQINDRKSRVEQEVQEEVEALKSDAQRAIQELEDEYQKNHTILAQGIVNILTGV